MGLKSDIKAAYVRHMTEDKKTGTALELTKEQDDKFEELSQDLTNAVVDFLTHDDLHWTISNLRASVELEEFNVSEDIDADLKNEIAVKNKISELAAAKTGTDLIVGKLEELNNKVAVAEVKILDVVLGPFIKLYKTFWKTTEKAVVKSIPESEGKRDINIPAFDFRKDGGKHGGELDGRGHAYVGIEDPVKNSDTMDPDSDDNTVELYRDKIPDELLD
jgi:hypothetical protein